MKKLILSISILLLLLSALPMLASCSEDADAVDGPVVKDAYGFWRPETCWLSECLVLPEFSSVSELFGTGGTSGLVSEKALSKDGQLGADGQGYLVCLFYGTHPEDSTIGSRLRLSLVNGTQILVDGEGVTLGDISTYTTGVRATLDMSKPVDRRLTVIGDGERLQGAVVIPFTVKSPGNLYATCSLKMESISANITVEDKAMATLAAKTSCGVSVDSFSVRYLTQEAFADGVYTEEDLINAPSLDGGDNCYAVVDLSYTATDDNDGDRYFNVLAYIPGRGVLDVTVEAAPTSRVTELNTTSGIAVSAAFSVPPTKGEQKTVRLLLRLLPVSGGDAEMDIFLSCSEDTALTGNTYFNGSYNTGEPTLEYTISEDGKYYTVTKILRDPLKSVTIPDELGDGVPVTGIADGLFRGNKSIQYLTIGNNVKRIEAYAFQGCSELRSVTMGTGVTFIGEGAFGDCLQLKTSGLFISDLEAWCRVELESATSNPLRYGSGFFLDGERITELVIPYGIEHIGNYAFCTGGTGLYITKIVIPNTVKTIGDYAFSGWNQYETLTLSSSLISIGNHAFSGGQLGTSGSKKLTALTIPGSVTSIGDGAFAWCSSLKTVSLPSGLTHIGQDAFADCEALTYTEYENARYLGNTNDPYIFLAKMASATATACTVPATTKAIAYNAFYDCGALQSITVEADNAIYCSVDGVLYTKDGTRLVQYPQGRRNESFAIPSGVTQIAPYAFYRCKVLKELTVGNAVSYIEDHAFCECVSLASVTLGAQELEIGASAFEKCEKLKSIALGGARKIGVAAFRACTVLERVDGGEHVTEIGANAFEDCVSLKSFVIGNEVKTVGESAFYDCDQMAELTIGQKVVSIGKYAFSGCKALTLVRFNATCITELGSKVFRYAGQGSSGIHVVIGANVTAIPDNLFYSEVASGNSSPRETPYITSVTFEQGSVCTEIGSGAFYNARITAITLPSSVTHIGSEAFAESRLATVVIPASVTYIGGYAFSGLGTVTYQGTVAQWNQIQKEAHWNGLHSESTTVVCADGNA